MNRWQTTLTHSATSQPNTDVLTAVVDVAARTHAAAPPHKYAACYALTGVRIMLIIRPCISGFDATAASDPTSSTNFCALGTEVSAWPISCLRALLDRLSRIIPHLEQVAPNALHLNFPPAELQRELHLVALCAGAQSLVPKQPYLKGPIRRQGSFRLPTLARNF